MMQPDQYPASSDLAPLSVDCAAFQALIVGVVCDLVRHNRPVSYELVAQQLGVPVWVLRACVAIREPQSEGPAEAVP